LSNRWELALMQIAGGIRHRRAQRFMSAGPTSHDKAQWYEGTMSRNLAPPFRCFQSGTTESQMEQLTVKTSGWRSS
jgi:hypothetical protein